MRFEKTDQHEERLALISAGTPRCAGLSGHQRSGIPIQRTDRPSLAHEIHRISMVWEGVILSGKPVVEPVIPWLWLCRQIEVSIEMPLPNIARVVSGIAQQSRHGDFRPHDMQGRVHGNPVIKRRFGMAFARSSSRLLRASRSGERTSSQPDADSLRRRHQFGKSSVRCLRNSPDYRIPDRPSERSEYWDDHCCQMRPMQSSEAGRSSA